VTIYIDSKVEGSGPSYTEGNTVYNLAGVVAFTWSIDGYGKLTIVVTQNGKSGQEVLEKVDKFKWE
jgi:hypothetical protein